jgi:hypothetical protein
MEIYGHYLLLLAILLLTIHLWSIVKINNEFLTFSSETLRDVNNAFPAGGVYVEGRLRALAKRTVVYLRLFLG